MKPLFRSRCANEHETYTRLRDWTDRHSEDRREFFNMMWKEYAPYAPKGFEKKLQIELHQRWWEMYLAVALIRLGFTPKKNKSDVGPDIVLELPENAVYIEAVAPSIGCSSDGVPEPIEKGVADFPERECLLRLTQALTDKKEKYRHYLDEGIVSVEACKIIALSASDLNQFGTLLDGLRPAPLSVLAGAGPTVLTKGGKRPPYSSHRGALARDSGSKVDAVLYDNPEFSIVSAVLYSPLDLWNAPLIPGESLSLFLNPLADIQVPSALKAKFTTWARDETESTEIVWRKSVPDPE